MNILVLGGSYFLGKHFVEMAHKEHTLTVFNRGSHPLDMEDVTELVGDRRVPAALSGLDGLSFDAVVDFCAYEKGDIRTLFENLHAYNCDSVFIIFNAFLKFLISKI